MPNRSDPPLILVAADYKEVDNYRWHAAADTYLKAIVIGIGGIPVILPSLGKMIDIEAVLDRVDGVLLPGSRSNVHPNQYGRPATPESEPYDTRRDETTLPLIRATIARGMPLFAICRGMQELNVALGGTLVAEVHKVAGRDVHFAPGDWAPDARFEIRQDVAVKAGGTLAGVLGTGTVRVNTLHRQAIDELAPGLAVEAVAPDGTIEAVRVANATGFAIGVQWHPEYWVESDEPSSKLFAAFGRAVRNYVAQRNATLTAAE
ncbi:MAG TPA: gamma-glutamyl-gamma-aminobutyrate hydrolase family protein [Bauldia sp.]|nr:gamma-glutamyl-gamma-aminobutyrate hydrolase family protein [Bauldia sp.]